MMYRLQCDVCQWSVRVDAGAAVVEIECGTEQGILKYECPNCLSMVQRELNPAALDGLLRCGVRVEWVGRPTGHTDLDGASTPEVARWLASLYDDAVFTDHLDRLRDDLGFD